jgi:hypothetical protein
MPEEKKGFWDWLLKRKSPLGEKINENIKKMMEHGGATDEQKEAQKKALEEIIKKRQF